MNNIKTYAFVDGSFNNRSKMYGYGGFLIYNNERYVLQGSGNDPELVSMRNISGELLGSIAAIEKAIDLGVTDLTIYYDYMGIEKWATGEWKRNKKYTKKYHEWFQSITDKIRVTFIKVKGHSGIEGNDEADQLAREAVHLK